jgi:hypothetical protein
MAADHWSQEYHLTRDGWVKGTYRYFSKIDGDEVARPDGAVETWEEDCSQRSMWSGDDYSYRLLWHDENIPEDERRALRHRVPSPFTKTPDGF